MFRVLAKHTISVLATMQSCSPGYALIIRIRIRDDFGLEPWADAISSSAAHTGILGLSHHFPCYALTSDAVQLVRLQSAANGSEGQLEAIGYANQLASHQANQLLQIRALLIAQQNVMATRNQALADREAKEGAAADRLRRSTFKPSSERVW